jgi:hypothetical protein
MTDEFRATVLSLAKDILTAFQKMHNEKPHVRERLPVQPVVATLSKR